MKLNLPKILSAHNIAIASFWVIAVTSWGGLGILHKSEKDQLTPHEWVLVITGSLSLIGGCCLSEAKSGNWTLDDVKPDRHTGDSRDDQGFRSGDVHVYNPLILETSFNLAESERQARCKLIAMIRNFGTGSNPLEAVQEAIQICSDPRLWIETARAETVYLDVERFYLEGKIWPIVRDNRIMWSLNPDYDPPEATPENEQTAEQTPFHPFRCCSQCKYIGRFYDFCAVVPLGCATSDPLEQCREFESKDDSTQGTELQFIDAPF